MRDDSEPLDAFESFQGDFRLEARRVVLARSGHNIFSFYLPSPPL